mgnify:CR=1 FL=1
MLKPVSLYVTDEFKFDHVLNKNMFVKHPYKGTTIGKMAHLDDATLDEFLAFNKKYYVPNNAILVVAGDIQVDKTKKMIQDYFTIHTFPIRFF